MKILNIIQGWKAYLLEEENELAKERATECKKCEFAVVGTFETILKDTIEEIQGLKCKRCGCPLCAKLRSKNETCPENKW